MLKTIGVNTKEEQREFGELYWAKIITFE